MSEHFSTRRDKHLWRWEAILLLGLALAWLAVPLTQVTIVTPPSAVAEPETVWLLSHGITSSLLVPDGRGGWIRYAYGDWEYYALGRSSLWTMFRALAWPTPAALSRATFPGPLTAADAAQHVADQLKLDLDEAYALEVDRHALAQLRTTLETHYQANLAQAVHYQHVTFVPHPQPYHYYSNSNHQVATWLRHLNCTVTGPGHTSNWEVGER